VEAILKRHGHPLVVASCYRQDHRSLAFGKQLIGPALFPYYMKVLSFNLGLTAIVILVIFTAILAGGKSVAVREGLWILFWNLSLQFAGITGIFALVEWYMVKHPDRLDLGKGTPLQLRELERGAGGMTISRSSSFSQVVGLAVSILWLRAIQTHPFLIFGPAAAFLRLAPVWQQVYPAIVFIYMVFIAQALVNFVRPEWVRLPHLARAVTSIMWLVMYFFLFKAGIWVLPSAEASEAYQHGIGIANQVIFYGLIAAVIVTIAVLLAAVRKLTQTSPRRGRGANRAAACP